MGELKKIVVGRDKFPMWFMDECSKGKLKLNYEDDVLKSIIVYSPTKTEVALPGDVIISYKSGLSVIKNDKAEKFGILNKKENK